MPPSREPSRAGQRQIAQLLEHSARCRGWAEQEEGPYAIAHTASDAFTSQLYFPDPISAEVLVTLVGAAHLDGQIIEPGHLAYLATGRTEISLAAKEPTRALLLGGLPFDDEVLMWCNFVARTRAEIIEAHRRLDGCRRAVRASRLAPPPYRGGATAMEPLTPRSAGFSPRGAPYGGSPPGCW